MNLYDTPALFGQNMSREQQNKFLGFYKEVFAKYNITTIHDCSIGAGGTTLPLAKLGYKISGSDLSETLLGKAKENFKKNGYDIELLISDFRNLNNVLQNTYDCIISTGNSLPHINNQDVRSFVKSISTKINENGLLFIDFRNWDKILKEKPLFNARDPLVMTEEEHTSLYHIWNWHDDQSVDFIFVTSTDKHGRHEKTSFTYAPTYYPLKYKDYENILNDAGFEIRQCFDMDYLWLNSQHKKNKTGDFHKDFNQINWYAILAQKVR
ncbi:class I SAM-dependent methyltransferase [Vallitalea okinawensis]|uniref:class I SAM-dependent methyltransferase n=1 Tax=Vallitalea okinawensis TaxID=2078660 RepID=UPI000CFB9ADA|nr:class I SAM-dependent methyltransferase [Vallitalea okinawensis]